MNTKGAIKFNEAIHKIDFLNKKLRKFKTPWYGWAIKCSWAKIDEWCRFLGYEGGK